MKSLFTTAADSTPTPSHPRSAATGLPAATGATNADPATRAATVKSAATPSSATATATTIATATFAATKARSAKATSASTCSTLEQVPNIGPSLAADLRLIGILHPQELASRDAFALYQSLCAKTGRRQDPCVLDTFLAATDFMRGAPPAPWWHYTAQRKAVHGQLDGGDAG